MIVQKGYFRMWNELNISIHKLKHMKTKKNIICITFHAFWGY